MSFKNMGRYRGYTIYLESWTDSQRSKRNTVVVLKDKPRNLIDQTLFNQALREDTKYNNSRGYQMIYERPTPSSAISYAKERIDSRVKRGRRR